MNELRLSLERVKEIAKLIKNVNICVIGDVCLDIYWRADMKKSKLSRETPHYPLPVVSEVYSPGGCGNVINNVNALKPNKLSSISVIADDWRGFLLTKYFIDNKIDTNNLIKRKNGVTPCYCKPLRMGISDVVYEDPRLDFENFEPIDEKTENELLSIIEREAEKCDVIAVSDQFKCGIITPKIRALLSKISKKVPVIVDSRERANEYSGVIVKPNEIEAAFALGEDIIEKTLNLDDFVDLAERLYKKNQSPAAVTLGDKGALWCDENGIIYAPTKKAIGEIDIVGAGDTFLSAFSCAFAATKNGAEALAFANLASGVTVKKIGTTGTATEEEITKKWEEYYK